MSMMLLTSAIHLSFYNHTYVSDLHWTSSNIEPALLLCQQLSHHRASHKNSKQKKKNFVVTEYYSVIIRERILNKMHLRLALTSVSQRCSWEMHFAWLLYSASILLLVSSQCTLHMPQKNFTKNGKDTDIDLYLRAQVHEQIKIQHQFCVAFGRGHVSKQPWIHDPSSKLIITLYHIWLTLTYKCWPESFWYCWRTVKNYVLHRGWCTRPILHQHWWEGGR